MLWNFTGELDIIVRYTKKLFVCRLVLHFTSSHLMGSDNQTKDEVLNLNQRFTNISFCNLYIFVALRKEI